MAGVNASQRASSPFRAASKTIVRECEITRQTQDKGRKGESLHFTLTPLFVWRSCVWKRIHFDAFRPSVQANTMSVFIVNASSENALESGSKRKRINIAIVFVWMVEFASKWKRWPKISQAHVFVVCAWSSTYVTTCNFIVFERFSVGSQKRIKTVVWTRIDRCVFDDNEKRILLKTCLRWKACSQG